MSIESRTPRWKQVYDALQQELPGYEYGSNFYTIAQICEKFKVSTITATRVLGEMQDEGLVEKIRRRGTVVRRSDREAVVWMLMAARRPSDWPHFDSRWVRIITAACNAAKARGVKFEFIDETHLSSLLASNGTNSCFGIVLTSALATQTIRTVRRSGLPHVFLDSRMSTACGPWARLDRHKVSELAVRHLLELGHRHIACIFGSLSERGWRQRLRGYRRALELGGVKFRWRLVADASSTEVDPFPYSGVEALHRGAPQLKSQVAAALDRLMALPRRPTAIIAGDDTRAAMLLELCRERGIQIPGDLSVVGFPNNPESRLVTPALTVVDGCYEEVSKAAVHLLLEQMFQGVDPAQQRVIIQPTLVVRASTAAPSTRGVESHIRSASHVSSPSVNEPVN